MDEARAAIAGLRDERARDCGLALLHEAPGLGAESDAAFRRLRARPENKGEYRLAEVYAFRGMHEEAFAPLQQMRDVLGREGASAGPLIWDFQIQIPVTAFLMPLHDDPRWAALVAEPG